MSDAQNDPREPDDTNCTGEEKSKDVNVVQEKCTQSAEIRYSSSESNGDSADTQSDLLINDVQVISAVKRRKIHVDAAGCLAYSQTQAGGQPLSNPLPLELKSKKFDRKTGLNPRLTSKQKKSLMGKSLSLSQQCQSTLSKNSKKLTFDSKLVQHASFPGIFSSFSGFTLASNLHTCPVVKPQESVDVRNCEKKTRKQNTLTRYYASQRMCSKNLFNQSEMAESQQRNSSQSKMYSPIKQISGTIYVSDTSSPGSPSPVKSSQEETSSIQDNPVVKRLFEGQRILSAKTAAGVKEKRRKLSNTAYKQNKAKQNKPLSRGSYDCEASSSNGEASDSGRNGVITSRNIECDEEAIKTCIVGKTFGLLEDDTSEDRKQLMAECGVNYFDCLPIEVLEQILCQLPMLDLCLNSNRVCKLWSNVISDPKFVPWKKLYHKFKKKQGDSYAIVVALMTKGDMIVRSKFLLGLIRFMRDFKPVTASNMISCLHDHKKFEWAKALIEERAPDCMHHGDPNPWSVIAALVIISDSVADIEDIFHCLTVSSSQATTMEITECLYCIATLLYAIGSKAGPDVWSGMHYRVFYALYLYENTCVSNHGMLQDAMRGKCGQQSLVKYSSRDTQVRLTHEQMRIIKYDPQYGDVVKIVAFAGTGKTTTLVRYTQMRPDKKFLLVVYNRSVCEHAKTKFPPNVTCKTGHGLAFGVTGRRYAAQKNLNTYGLKVYDIAMVLPPRKGENLFVRAKFVNETLNNFLASDSPNITSAHAPNKRQDDSGSHVPIEHEAKMKYAEDAEYLWKRMKDQNDKQVCMTHDGYLKIFQLLKYRLHDYDMILLDEAQDMTPAVIDILMSQSQAKILVGDPHQQIYSFRGAVNAMSQITASRIFYLTQSFRFGPEISQVAASCLEVFKDVRDKTIVGHGKPGKITGEQVGQLAIISRCNFTVFSEAAKKCCYSKENWRVAFVGGTTAFGFDMLQDIYTLMLSPGDRIKEKRTIAHKLIRSFANLAELEKYASRTTDSELLGKIRIVRTFHHTLPMCISRILARCTSDMSQADIIFSTAHKAKGLEFSTVRVTDDYVSSGPLQNLALRAILTHDVRIPVDEVNLLYVAVTRAKKALQLSPMLIKVLADAGENFDFPVLSTELVKEQSDLVFKCFVTDEEFKPKALTLRRKKLSLGEGTVQGGLHSPLRLSVDQHCFAELLGKERANPKATQDSSEDSEDRMDLT